MSWVDDRDRGFGGMRALESDGDGLRRSRLLGRRVVPDCENQGTVLLSGEQSVFRVELDTLVSEFMQ